MLWPPGRPASLSYRPRGPARSASPGSPHRVRTGIRTRTPCAGTSTSSWRVCQFRHSDQFSCCLIAARAAHPLAMPPETAGQRPYGHALMADRALLDTSYPHEPRAGIEPATSDLRDRRSCRLSYRGLAPGQGLEPQLQRPERCVLPKLDDPGITWPVGPRGPP